MAITLDGTSGINNDATNLNYTGTLTGGTGVVNLGSGQFYKDASGNVGIGTSSPLGVLDVNAANTDVRFNSTTGTNIALLRIINSGGTFFLGRDNSTGSNFGAAYASLLWNSGAQPILFATSDTERMRIDSSGNLLVGTTSDSTAPSTGFSFNPQTAGAYAAIGHTTSAGSGSFFISFGYNSNVIGTITQNGTTGVSYNTSSDYRLKHDIQPMTGALAKVQQLKPVTYKWNADDSDGEGFIAHELQEVCPSAVTGEKDAVDAEGKPVYQGIDTSFLVATLTAAIQEQQAIIESLTARIEALENQT
jgi:hypothetical protein